MSLCDAAEMCCQCACASLFVHPCLPVCVCVLSMQTTAIELSHVKCPSCRFV